VSHNKYKFVILFLHIAIFYTGSCLMGNLDSSFYFIGIIILLIVCVLGVFGQI